ncbi:MAG: hypothetical protein GWO38_01950 [Phycisphaerae bacterium]|nr:hypothetical protein [Phycisphaerae bacterium]NIP53586.1 hypothetical protein [Phycisphaerae bacterium]NIW95209.1 hypothetical protein [Phycisphaerae bacterium]NIW99884.1 hypothetical protein [Phycisphaerae bacterium]NIX26406.1 hypothetical protein [Phycisphaerae bacterium]
MGGNFQWRQYIPFTDLESDHRSSHPDLPKVAGWVLIIPAYQCTTKYAFLPSTDPAEIEKMLEFELSNIVPYNTQPWSWDFSIIGRQEDEASKVLIVLSPLSIIDRYIQNLLSLGIRPNVITVNAVFYNLLLKKDKTSLELNPMAYFYPNNDYLDFFVIQNRQVTFLRGARLKGKLCEKTRFVEAEIQRSLSMLKENRFANWPNKLITINVNNSAVDFGKIVERVTGVSVEEIESATLFGENSSIIERLTTISSDDYLSSSSEKDQISLLPRFLKQKLRRRKKRRQMILHALKVCFVLLLAFLCLKTSIWRKNRLLLRYEQRLSAISPMAEKLQFLKQQLDIIQSQLQSNVSTLDIVSELYRVLPKDVTVHYLSIEREKKITTRAQAKLLSQAFDCIGPLEQSDYFQNVKQNYANQRQIQDSLLIDFEVTANLQQVNNRKGEK